MKGPKNVNQFCINSITGFLKLRGPYRYLNLKRTKFWLFLTTVTQIKFLECDYGLKSIIFVITLIIRNM